MLTIIDAITAAFLGAIEAGGQSLAQYMLPILSVCAIISWYREYSVTVMSSGAGLGDALAHALTLILVTGAYLFFLLQLFDIATAALNTFFYWGLLGAGTTVTTDQLQTPSFIMEAGLKAARPIADFSTWWGAVKATVRLAGSVPDTLAYIGILAAFIGITAHHMVMLIEFHLSVMLASVLVPWGVWRLTSGIGEFALGWMTGGLIRAIISSTLIGIATPAFELLNQPQPEAGFFSFAETWILLAGALIYLALAWTIPARAATMAAHASLGLTGSTLASAAMTFARFGMMASSVGGQAGRVISSQIRRS